MFLKLVIALKYFISSIFSFVAQNKYFTYTHSYKKNTIQYNTIKLKSHFFIKRYEI